MANRQREQPSTQHEQIPLTNWMATTSSDHWLTATDRLHFARSGLQHNLIRRLRSGKISPEVELDLHGQTVAQATTLLTRFIADCVIQQKRCVSIIHGKGQFSAEGKPILKNFLNQWLPTQSNVLAFHSAKAHHGGAGAVYVLLRKMRSV